MIAATTEVAAGNSAPTGAMVAGVGRTPLRAAKNFRWPHSVAAVWGGERCGARWRRPGCWPDGRGLARWRGLFHRHAPPSTAAGPTPSYAMHNSGGGPDHTPCVIGHEADIIRTGEHCEGIEWWHRVSFRTSVESTRLLPCPLMNTMRWERGRGAHSWDNAPFWPHLESQGRGREALLHPPGGRALCTCVLETGRNVSDTVSERLFPA